jgi:hypothetical protein
MRGLWMCCLCLLMGSLVLTNGCGGGSNSSNANQQGGSSTVTAASQAQGVYEGQAQTGQSFETIILPNDQIWALYGSTSGGVFYVSGMLTGAGKSQSGSYTANVTDFYYTGQTFSGSVSASYTPNSSIAGTYSEVGQVPLTFSGAVSQGFNYNAPASLSDVAGSWTGAILDGSIATITVNPDATFSGSDFGCNFTGTIKPDPSGKNFFDVSTTFSGNCTPHTASGIAVDYPLPNGGGRQLVVGVATSGWGTGFVATR